MSTQEDTCCVCGVRFAVSECDACEKTMDEVGKEYCLPCMEKHIEECHADAPKLTITRLGGYLRIDVDGRVGDGLCADEALGDVARWLTLGDTPRYLRTMEFRIEEEQLRRQRQEERSHE